MPDKNMTLFCDASYCPDTSVAGWGAWAKRESWPAGVRFGGNFKTKMPSSSVAELCALVNAVATAYRRDWLKGIKHLLIQSDCMTALHMLHDNVKGVQRSAHMSEPMEAHMAKMGNYRNKHQLVLEAGAYMNSLCSRQALTLTIRYVGGHKNNSSRHYINNMCDATAKYHMRQTRKIIRGA